MDKGKKMEIALVGLLLVIVVLIGVYLYQEKEANGEGMQSSVSMEYLNDVLD